MARSAARIGVSFLAALLLPIAVRGASSADCLACHGDASLSMERGGRSVSLHVGAKVLEESVHASFDCTDCHAGLDPSNVPHAARIEPVSCAGCHADAPEKHPFHASMARGESPVDCKDCHGTHEVARAAGGKFARPNLVRECGACHGDVALRFDESDHGKALRADAKGAPDCLSCHARPLTEAAEPDAAKRKMEQEKLCLSCHLDDPDVRAGMVPAARFIEAYAGSVHGSALRAGNGAAANCVSCHGSHEMRTGMDPKSRTTKAHIPETCAQCHGAIALEYAESVHGVALRQGKVEAPVCTDCHGEHDIYPHDDPRSPVAAANVSAKVCSPCHSSLKLAQKYEVASDRTETYADSYHGLAVRGGSVEAANCASCHGSHGIRPSSDPTSTIHKRNLAKTCGKCHPGANEKFAVGSVHVAIAQGKEPILYWIATGYVALILLTIGGMFLHNLLDLLKKLGRKLHTHRNGADHEEELPHALYVRMTLSERLQHVSLVVSFALLALTGFMLRFPDAFWVAALRRLWSGVFEFRSALHRTAAAVLVLASFWHIGYVSFTTRGRQLIRDLLPGREDLHDVGRVLRYNLGLSRTKPRFGRFGYVEKSEYWALIWGTIVMAVTGAILWFDNTFIGLLTKLGSDVARTVHFYEAVLATLAIIVWHFYYVIFNPDVYPMSFAWLTGKITEREMAEEHGAELAAIRRARLEEEQRAMEAAAGTKQVSEKESV